MWGLVKKWMKKWDVDYIKLYYHDCLILEIYSYKKIIK